MTPVSRHAPACGFREPRITGRRAGAADPREARRGAPAVASQLDVLMYSSIAVVVAGDRGQGEFEIFGSRCHRVTANSRGDPFVNSR